jgi:hypothetical protein
MVTMRANITISGTSNTQEMGFAAATVPAAMRPSSERNCFYPVTDNGSIDHGLIQINSDGSIDFFNGLTPNTASTFTASGTKGFTNNIEVTYPLNLS